MTIKVLVIRVSGRFYWPKNRKLGYFFSKNQTYNSVQTFEKLENFAQINCGNLSYETKKQKISLV